MMSAFALLFWTFQWLVGCYGYALAHKQGRFPLRWGWLCFLFIFPLGLLWRDRKLTPDGVGPPESSWRFLAAHNPEFRQAVDRLRPLGEAALARLAVGFKVSKDTSKLPMLVQEIEEQWTAHRERGFAVIETQRGMPILRDAGGTYHVGELATKELRMARVMASMARTSGAAKPI